MNDQASTLRLMTSTVQTAAATTGRNGSKQMRCLAVTGGKGGVGKSNLAVNLSLELGSLGNRVALLDADFGLANADLLCGVSPQFHLGHVISGVKELEDITVQLTKSVNLLPGGSGIEELANFSLPSRPHLFAQLQAMEKDLDFMLIDTAAGIGEGVMSVLVAAAEVIVVATPEPTSIVDAYATIKVILRHSPAKPISIVINNVVGVGDAEQVYQPINAAVRGFLDHEVSFLGMVPSDSQVSEAIREQVPVVQYAPQSPASRAVRLIAKQLHGQKKQNSELSKAQSFWDALAKTD